MTRSLVLLAFLFVAAPMLSAQQTARPTAEHPHFAVEVVGSGPHVVLIPGLASGPRTWAETVPALGGYTVHRVTLAGFAGVPAAEGDALLDPVRDEVAEYVAGLDGPVVVVGHSLGGFTALRVAAQQPEGLAGIVIVDSVPFLAGLMDPDADAASARAQNEPAAAFMASMTPEQVRASQQMGLATMTSDPADVADLLEDNAYTDGAAMGMAFVELIGTDARADLAHVQVPTLVTAAGAAYGDQDVAALYAKQYDGLEGVRIEIVPETKHFLMRDDPETFNRLLTGFLAEVASGS